MQDSLLTSLKKLRLSGLTGSLEIRLQEAAGNKLSYEQFLELILQDELLIRNERLINRRVKAAAFRELKTLEDFDWQFNPSIKKKQIYDFAACKFIRQVRFPLRNRKTTTISLSIGWPVLRRPQLAEIFKRPVTKNALERTAVYLIHA